MQKARATALAVVEQQLSATIMDKPALQHVIIIDDNMHYRSVYPCIIYKVEA